LYGLYGFFFSNCTDCTDFYPGNTPVSFIFTHFGKFFMKISKTNLVKMKLVELIFCILNNIRLINVSIDNQNSFIIFEICPRSVQLRICSRSVHLRIYLSICMSFYLFFYLFVFISSVYLYVYVSICFSVYLSVYLSVCLFIYLSISLLIRSENILSGFFR